jgi:hypothetical protein
MFTLTEVVPWGRSLGEYQRMFALGSGDLARRIIGCADGPASFNAEATRLGGRVISCDPIYQWRTAEIQARIDATFDRVLEQTRQNVEAFVWNEPIGSVEALGRVRRQAMRAFLDDFDRGRRDGRYVAAALPNLPFHDGRFDLALGSHFLFLYSDQLGESFHRAAAMEMCRVASEARIFPLLALGGRRSPYVETTAAALRASGLLVTIERVPYEFQRGGNEMMRIRRAAIS